MLTNVELVQLNKNYQVEGQFIGGIQNDKPYWKGSKRELYDYRVSTKNELINVLSIATKSNKSNVIYIPKDIEIDLTGEKGIVLSKGLTIIGDRGIDGSAGAKIFTTESGVFPLFKAMDSVTIKGIRIEGGDKDMYYNNIIFEGDNASKLNTYKNPVSSGIQVFGSNFVMINCEMSGWTHTAVHIKENSENNIFKYNYFHHNRRVGLGYGITVDGGKALIIANLFDHNRHDIAGSGTIGSGYEVYLNVFLRNTYGDSVDMHGGKDRKDGTNISGDYISIYNNYFEREVGGRKAVYIRGVPLKMSYIENNYVFVKKETDIKSNNKESLLQFKQVNQQGNLVIEENYITVE
ncbi:right-handed parallel beta-helix repeat-containing protein [Myroides odoratimimus]|uniref:right-handed parallel beta-helix repeat-containing protein n=1 Tax=Myroides odoratimimus TaxID=76832 RepID=UPI0025765C9A|nr:right-handed parallel beta-helix repeat-containing protein [Myroides odoratimimus]